MEAPTSSLQKINVFREASKIKNRLNLPDLPPSPQSWDAYFNISWLIL